MDTKQSPTNLGLPFEGINCLVVFPTHFNPNKSLLILLHVWLVHLHLVSSKKSQNGWPSIPKIYLI